VKKTYKTPRRSTSASRTRKYLDEMKIANAREEGQVTTKSSGRGVRARLQQQRPDASAEEIETSVARVLAAGAKPSKGSVLTPGTIPTEVAAERKAARKKTVRAGRTYRRNHPK